MTRRYRRRPSLRLLLAALLVVAVGARLGCDALWFPANVQQAGLHEGPCEVVRVVDGDTLIVRQVIEGQATEGRLRLLGIDCPESVKPDHPVEPWGPEAAQFTRDFVAEGQPRLQLDRRRKDRDGRFLAYLLVDEQMLNIELVRAGLARVQTFPGDSQSIGRRLERAQREAQAEARGIW